jgi:PhoD related phosphatase
MVNVVSSAITNAPPPNAVANLLHRRNRVHHLNWHTHENLMALFREDPSGQPRKNNSTMPARNYAIITEHAGLAAAQRSNTIDGDALYGQVQGTDATGLGGHEDMKIASDEKGGTKEHNISAAAPRDGTTRPFALDIAFRVEIDPKDHNGQTKSYGFSIPALEGWVQPLIAYLPNLAP